MVSNMIFFKIKTCQSYSLFSAEVNISSTSYPLIISNTLSSETITSHSEFAHAQHDTQTDK